LDPQPLADLGRRQVLQPERLHPVAAVAGEPPPHRPLDLPRPRPRPEDLGQVGRQGLTAAPVEAVEDAAPGPAEGERQWRGEPADQLPGDQPATRGRVAVGDHLPMSGPTSDCCQTTRMRWTTVMAVPATSTHRPPSAWPSSRAMPRTMTRSGRSAMPTLQANPSDSALALI